MEYEDDEDHDDHDDHTDDDEDDDVDDGDDDDSALVNTGNFLSWLPPWPFGLWTATQVLLHASIASAGRARRLPGLWASHHRCAIFLIFLEPLFGVPFGDKSQNCFFIWEGLFVKNSGPQF